MSKRVRRKASTFPPSFLKVFTYVMNTGESLFINTLENRRPSYTSLRARLSEFRKSFHTEAMQSGNPQRMEMADQLYSVSLREPEEREGLWGLPVEYKDQNFADALDAIIPGDVDVPAIPDDGKPMTFTKVPDTDPGTSDAIENTAKAIRDVFGKEDGD